MAVFNDGYYHPLDREYGQVWTPHADRIIEPIEDPIKVDDPNKITTQDMGTSFAMMQPGAESLKSRIFHGASRVELAFTGAGKGSKEGLTPESYGKEERQAMRDLARINKVNVSTHATIALNGLSGFNQQEGGFTESARKFGLTEIQRAIDFAADASTGGAVVVHTGEFPRSIARYYGKEGIKNGKARFREHEREEEEAFYHLVDSHTGKIISAVKEDEVVWMPIQRKVIKDGKEVKVWLEGIDEKKGGIIEVEHEVVKSYLDDLRTKFEKDPDRYKEKLRRAEERLEEKRIPVYETDKYGNIKTKAVTFNKFKQQFKKSDGTVDTKRAAFEFFKVMQDANLKQALGQAREYEQMHRDELEAREKLLDVYDKFEKLKEKTPPDQQHKLRAFVSGELKNLVRGVPDYIPEPEKFLKRALNDNERRIAYGRETSVSGRLRAREMQDRIVNAQDIEDYAVKKTSNTLADAGMYAMERTNKTNRELEKQGMQKIDPIYISPENIFQDRFGSHPTELKRIVKDARLEMTERLKQKGYKEDKAIKMAEKHIVGTFDIGHANIWKKYYKSDPKKSVEENEKDFNKWLIDQAKDLIKSGIVKHIHVTDNFGFHDEHLAIGQGTAPIKELIKVLEKEGIKDIIIEPGSTNAQTIWPDSLRGAGSPIYAAGRQYGPGFNQIHQTYAGQINPPYTSFRPDVPSEEQWQFWSQVPLD